MALSDARMELVCSICLNIYTNPVTLLCGHNFCRDCIDRVLDTQEGSGVYSCPECRVEFQERPELNRNITLRNIVENLQLTEPAPEESQTFCTYCILSPVSAVKSCLHCEASLCDNHLKVHSKSSQHVLSDLTAPLENKKCSVHKKTLEYYCIEDSACLCGSCRLHGEHQDHYVEALEEASKERKENLTVTLQEMSKKREEMEQSIEDLQKYKRKVQGSAAGVTKRAIALFRDIRRQLDTLERKVLNEISMQAERDSLAVSHLIQEMELKKDELSRKIRHIEEICNMTDPLTVLQESDAGDLCDTEDGDDEDTKRLNKLLCGGGNLNVTGSHRHTGISDIVKRVGIHTLDPAYIVLDVKTAHRCLILDDGKMARTESLNHYALSNLLGGKKVLPQVLSQQSFSSGQHYWDVDVGKSSYWRVGMCYSTTNQKQSQSQIGENYTSWCLERNSNELSVKHKCSSSPLSGNFLLNRVRMFLDYEAGQISFYKLGIPIRHLHTFTVKVSKVFSSTCTFNEPLYVGLCVGEGSIKMCRGNEEM
ncbi:LOW QUALITY PROTEIN: E3 ubiquitin/ISG15 ligase TRIM25-like [Mantella aurantiaca]